LFSTEEPRAHVRVEGARRFRRLFFGAVVIAGSLAATIWYAVSRGQDFNWDQQHYHIAMSLLFSQGRLWDSVAPAGPQSYFNPFMQNVQFWGIQHLAPVWFAIALAAVQSLGFVIAGFICAQLTSPARNWKALGAGLLGFVLCLMAPVSLSESGTTFVDLIAAAPVLAAFALLLNRGHPVGLTLSGALAGALLGLATALKLTNAVFFIGGLGFALAGPDTTHQRLRWIVSYGAAALSAYLIMAGNWHLELWKRFGNPFFPFFNNIFRSPDFDFTALREDSFLPKSVFGIWRYPLYWFEGDSPTTYASASAEAAFVDARWIVAITGVTLMLAALILFRQWRRQRLNDASTGLFFVFAIGYLIWLNLFAIHRYIVALDILCGAIILALAVQFRSDLIRLAILACCAALTVHKIVVPDWGHLPWLPHWQGINPTPYALQRNSIVFLASPPDSFVAASLPSDARYVEVSDSFDLRSSVDTSLVRQLKRMLAEPNTSLKIIDRGTTSDLVTEMLKSHGLHISDHCETLQVVEAFRLCSVER
jgi:Glycosyltransferase family 87